MYSNRKISLAFKTTDIYRQGDPKHIRNNLPKNGRENPNMCETTCPIKKGRS